jgi:formylglycine-generating enzyme
MEKQVACFAFVSILAGCHSTPETTAVSHDERSWSSPLLGIGIADGSAPPALVDAALSCPASSHGPEMVMISAPPGKRYCVDRTLVTQSQYQEFVNAAGSDLSLLPQKCEFQHTYQVIEAPGDDNHIYGCPKGLYDPAARPNHPMQCLTWCSAYAYCSWAGKRLCGKIGGGPLVDVEKNTANAQENQWYNACSQGGSTTFAYGNVYNVACSVKGNVAVGDESPLCAASSPAFSALQGMSSGVGEWQDACIDGVCLYSSPQCDRPGAGPVGLMYPRVGFRCCADVD